MIGLSESDWEKKLFMNVLFYSIIIFSFCDLILCSDGEKLVTGEQ